MEDDWPPADDLIAPDARLLLVRARKVLLGIAAAMGLVFALLALALIEALQRRDIVGVLMTSLMFLVFSLPVTQAATVHLLTCRPKEHPTVGLTAVSGRGVTMCSAFGVWFVAEFLINVVWRLLLMTLAAIPMVGVIEIVVRIVGGYKLWALKACTIGLAPALAVTHPDATSGFAAARLALRGGLWRDQGAKRLFDFTVLKCVAAMVPVLVLTMTSWRPLAAVALIAAIGWCYVRYIVLQAALTLAVLRRTGGLPATVSGESEASLGSAPPAAAVSKRDISADGLAQPDRDPNH